MDGGQSRELYFTYSDCNNRMYLAVFDLYYDDFEYAGPFNRYSLDFLATSQATTGSLRTVKIFNSNNYFFIAGHLKEVQNGDTSQAYTFSKKQAFVTLFDTAGTSQLCFSFSATPETQFTIPNMVYYDNQIDHNQQTTLVVSDWFSPITAIPMKAFDFLYSQSMGWCSTSALSLSFASSSSTFDYQMGCGAQVFYLP